MCWSREVELCGRPGDHLEKKTNAAAQQFSWNVASQIYEAPRSAGQMSSFWNMKHAILARTQELQRSAGAFGLQRFCR